MNQHRRQFVTAVGAASFAPLFTNVNTAYAAGKQMVLSDFGSGYMLPGATWRGFSDRVMGGISDVQLESTTITGKTCARLTGTVTRENNGGFIQMALGFGKNYKAVDATGFAGVELEVFGNNEDYNVHIRTQDCRWYDESYRYTFFAKPEWQSIRIPFEAFEANKVSAPLDNSGINRLAVLGWMREFKADVALTRIAFYS